MIIVKTEREISLIREAGEIVAGAFDTLKPQLKPGMSTLEVNNICEEYILSKGAIPASKGYYGYPCAVCVSVNDTLVHGIASSKEILKSGDIVSVDIVVKYKNYHADAARTFEIGQVSELAKKLVRVTRESFFEAVKLIKPGVRLGDICSTIQNYNESHGFSLPREFTGHGIGLSMHEEPMIPNYGKANTGPILQEGMVLAIEPMVSAGSNKVRVLKDNWTAKIKDGKLSSHYENTVVVTSDGYEILTLTKEEKHG